MSRLAPVRVQSAGRKKRQLRGYSVLVRRNGVTAVDGSITRRDGGIPYNPGVCDRNIWLYLRRR